MTRRRRFKRQCFKQLPSIPNRQKPCSRRQRRRRKLRTRSMSIETQIAVDAFDMLHISTTKSNIKPFEFIKRYEITRQEALIMPRDRQPIVFFIDQKNNRMLSNDLCNSMDEDYYSSCA